MRNYNCFALRAKGYNHIANNLECQDNTCCDYDNNFVLVAVADGHGSPQYFRSARGSEFAVKSANNKLKEFIKTITLSEISDKKSEIAYVTQLINSIITDWHRRVKQDYTIYPFEEDELRNVPQKYLDAYRNGKAFEKAYGSTLIAAAKNNSFTIGIHIGDGKCVALYEDGTMDEPIPWDENCHLNKCTSICDENASLEFRYYVWGEKQPIAVFLGTDGLDDTYADFLQGFYRSVAVGLAGGEFIDKVNWLEGLLPDISRRGSKDDVSIAAFIDIQKVEKIINQMQTDIDLSNVDGVIVLKEGRLDDVRFLYEKTLRLYKKALAVEIDSEKSKELKGKSEEYEKQLAALKAELTVLQKKKAEILFHKNNCCSIEYPADRCCPQCGYLIGVVVSTIADDIGDLTAGLLRNE